MSDRIVLHRKPHPQDGSRRWFTHKGRDYAVADEGPGWGYSIYDIETSGGVADGLFTLADVRRSAPGACDEWWDIRQVTEAERRGICGCCGATKEQSDQSFCHACYNDDACNPPFSVGAHHHG